MLPSDVLAILILELNGVALFLGKFCRGNGDFREISFF